MAVRVEAELKGSAGADVAAGAGAFVGAVPAGVVSGGAGVREVGLDHHVAVAAVAVHGEER